MNKLPLGMTQNEVDEARGLYFEEVGKLVDGVEAEIIETSITTKMDAMDQLLDAIHVSEWVSSDNHWAIHTIVWSQFPCAAFVDPGESTQYELKLSRVTPRDYVVIRREDAFPFGWIAKAAMSGDCLKEMLKRKAYQDLPDYPRGVK